MDKELRGTLYMLAWLLNSAVWTAAFHATGSVLAAVFAAVWLALGAIVWWSDLRVSKRGPDAPEQKAG